MLLYSRLPTRWQQGLRRCRGCWIASNHWREVWHNEVHEKTGVVWLVSLLSCSIKKKPEGTPGITNPSVGGRGREYTIRVFRCKGYGWLHVDCPFTSESIVQGFHFRSASRASWGVSAQIISGSPGKQRLRRSSSGDLGDLGVCGVEVHALSHRSESRKSTPRAGGLVRPRGSWEAGRVTGVGVTACNRSIGTP